MSEIEQQLIAENLALKEETRIQRYLIELLKKDRRGMLTERDIDILLPNMDTPSKMSELIDENARLKAENEFFKYILDLSLENGNGDDKAVSKGEKLKWIFRSERLATELAERFRRNPNEKTAVDIEKNIDSAPIDEAKKAGIYLKLSKAARDIDPDSSVRFALKAWRARPQYYILKWLAHRFQDAGMIKEACLTYRFFKNKMKIDQVDLKKSRELERLFSEILAERKGALSRELDNFDPLIR
ncbi:MAG: hypothetical protein HDQ93_03980 [Desulfovibrio sp.]|nr:hypothetical protein [Desulfovibrio sp.]